MTVIRRVLTLLAGLWLVSGVAWADAADDEFEQKPWQEIEVQLPPFPQDGQFQEFYVSATASSRFYVDVPGITVGSDGVVRYVLMAIAPSGVRNITFEGMRCQTRERRIYASGRSDGTWSRARSERWLPVREATSNRQHAALFTDFFCPDGVLNYAVEDIRRALKKQGQPLGGRP